MRVMITVEYDGTDFCGWQIQPEKRSVQGVLQEALASVLGEPVVLHGSGRTDAGVHSVGQTAHFDISRDFPLNKLALAVNTRLPRDVSVKTAVKADDDFEAQYSAKKKTYRYDFYLSRVSRPLSDRYAARVPYSAENFDVNKAKDALSFIEGTHDFAAFSNTGRPVKSSVRTIYSASITDRGNGAYSIILTGNGFLYNMVRVITGTVVEVALSARPVSDVKKALETGLRSFCGKTFPPQGLTLVSVDYDV